MRQIKVMILHAPTELAGAEGVILNMNAFLDKGQVRLVNCPFVNFGRGASEYLHALESRGIAYQATALVRRFEYRYVSQTAKIAREYDIDIIHSHGYRSDVTAILASRGRIPLVSTLHGFTASNARIVIYEWIQGMVLRFFDALIAVSSEVAKKAQRLGVSPRRIHHVRNVVDYTSLSRTEKSCVFKDLRRGDGIQRLVFVGRLSPEKGVDLAIAASAALVQRGIQHLLLIVGDGPMRSHYEDLVRARGLSNCIEFLGFRRDATSIIAAANALVLPSRTEGMPLVVLEAMAVGTPVVVSRVGELPQVIQDGVNGLLFEPGDSQGLANCLVWIAGHRTEAQRIAVEAKLYLKKNMEPGQWAQDITAVYRSVLERTGRGCRRATTDEPSWTK